MSHHAAEVSRFIDANERHLVDQSRHKSASNIAEGDVITVPGAELHDDLAGLTITVRADAVDRREGVVYITDRRDGTIWFRDSETVRIDESTYAPSRLA